MKDNTNIALIVGVALVVGAAGFFVGMHYSARRLALPMGNRMGMMRGRGFGGNSGGPGKMMGSAGQITAISGNTVTLKLPNGNTQAVTLSDTAVVDTMTKGTAKDLKVGENIIVSGTGFWNGTQTVIVSP